MGDKRLWKSGRLHLALSAGDLHGLCVAREIYRETCKRLIDQENRGDYDSIWNYRLMKGSVSSWGDIDDLNDMIEVVEERIHKREQRLSYGGEKKASRRGTTGISYKQGYLDHCFRDGNAPYPCLWEIPVVFSGNRFFLLTGLQSFGIFWCVVTLGKGTNTRIRKRGCHNGDFTTDQTGRRQPHAV